MFMSPDDIKAFPRCAKLLQSLEGTLKGNKKTFDAWLQACMADVQRQDPALAKKIALTKALPWAAGPRVELSANVYTLEQACGLTTPPFNGIAANGFLILNIYFVAFEYAGAADRPANESRLTTTVLHELVHWVRQKANATMKVLDADGNLVEAGEFFEKLAFGATQGCTPDDISDALSSIPPSKQNLDLSTIVSK